MAKSAAVLIADTCKPAAELASLKEEIKLQPLLLPSLQFVLSNGLARGIIAEITGSRSSGRTSLASNVLKEATARGEICAVVDLYNSFDPASASHAGIILDRLVWVRCSGNAEHAVRSADLLLHAGGFGVVLLDLCDASARILNRIPISYWHRFRRAIEHTPSVLLISADSSQAKSSAATTVTLQRRGVRWSGSAPFLVLRGMELTAKAKSLAVAPSDLVVKVA